jgi:ADP-L-glycero-D-manno-heptose 6-epimerase
MPLSSAMIRLLSIAKIFLYHVFMIVVTGGAGFIGSAFVWKLNQHGITDILIVDNLSESEKWKNLVGLRYENYLHKDDFLDYILVDSEIENIDAIIHMGACSATTELDTDYLMDNNFRYTQTLAEWCLKHTVYFLYASSAATYGNGDLGFSDECELTDLKPINRYGYSKHFFDLYAKRKGWLDSIVGLKFFNVFGPNEGHKGPMRSIVCKAYEQISSTGQLSLFKSHRSDYKHGDQMRDFVYIKDVINYMWWLLNNRHVTGIYNIGSGVAKTWNELAASIFKAMDKEINIHYIDMPESIRNQYQYFTEAPMKKICDQGCSITPHSLDESVADYISTSLFLS